MDARQEYKWVNLIAIVWVALCVIIFCLPYSPLGVPGDTGFTLNYVNYAPVVVIVVMLGVTIWYFGWETRRSRARPDDRRSDREQRPQRRAGGCLTC